jgi:hypothetical protein
MFFNIRIFACLLNCYLPADHLSLSFCALSRTVFTTFLATGIGTACISGAGGQVLYGYDFFKCFLVALFTLWVFAPAGNWTYDF